MEKRSYLFGRDHSIDPRNRPIPELVPTARTNLYTLFDDNEEKSSSAESLVSKDTASVYLRVRPTVNDSHFSIENNYFKIFNNDRSVEKQFKFTGVFSDGVLQREVYSSSIESSIDNDENLTLLMYGTSGSGKTYTLMGDADQPGIIPRAIEHIFTRYGGSIKTVPHFRPVGGTHNVLSDDEIDTELLRRKIYFQSNTGSIFSGDKEKIQSEHNFIELDPSQTSVYIWISFFEIYNENLNDLLEVPPTNPKKRDCLKMISNSGKTFVKNLTSVFTMSSEEATQLLTMGLNSRLNASTGINQSSSRSHCVFLIDVIKYERKIIFHNSYKFCDLAGSERVKKSETTGSRLKEAQNINTSLLVLGRCLNVTTSNQKNKTKELVPFRESKLTVFLQSALKGVEKLSMIVNIWPISEFYEENLHVLKYALMAQEISHRAQASVPRNSISRRYSFFLGPQQNELTEQDPNLSILLDENYRLKEINQEFAEENDNLYAEIDQLNDEKDELIKINQLIEQTIRKEMTELMKSQYRRKEQAVETRLQVKIDFLMKTHAEDMAELKEKLKKRNEEIDRLYDELDKANGGVGSDDSINAEVNGRDDSDTFDTAINGHDDTALDDSNTITID